MSEKRKRDDAGTREERKRQKKGFSVGPQNLPDGQYRRKTIEIKRSLIDKAKIKKEYGKMKKQGKVPDQEEFLPVPASMALDEQKIEEELAEEEEPTTEPHPDRQTLIEKEADEPEQEARNKWEERPRGRRQKVIPFKREHEQAMKRKEEAEARRRAREEAERERQQKIEEREKFRKAMAKARTGGKNGQRKLGRESTVLLDKITRLTGAS